MKKLKENLKQAVRQKDGKEYDKSFHPCSDTLISMFPRSLRKSDIHFPFQLLPLSFSFHHWFVVVFFIFSFSSGDRHCFLPLSPSTLPRLLLILLLLLLLLLPLFFDRRDEDFHPNFKRLSAVLAAAAQRELSPLSGHQALQFKSAVVVVFVVVFVVVCGFLCYSTGGVKKKVQNQTCQFFGSIISASNHPMNTFESSVDIFRM